VYERGLYETLITEAVVAELARLSDQLVERRDALRPAEAAQRIALHVSRVLERAIAAFDEKTRAREGTVLARQLIELVGELAPRAMDLSKERPVEPGVVLRAIVGRLLDGREEPLAQPLIPLLDTTLLTNARGEPNVGSQVLAEIHSASRIDLVMAFIRLSGIAPLLEPLRLHCAAQRQLRVLTTTYTNSTEARALEALQDVGAEVRVSYDTTTTRLHAKAWLFHRGSGYSTAYIGSSNLTHSAQVSGQEWNMRVSGARNPDVIDKFRAVFESYWESADFVPYERAQFAARAQAQARPDLQLILSPIEIRLEQFQERLLEQIALSREQGHHQNLLVSATGTGKTVMAAVWYARLRQDLARTRLLFVAHREEILAQSLATFRHALRDPTFGELWVGGSHPLQFEHVFASIQSLDTAGLERFERDRFDVIIVDEFHHAAASSYRRLLDHVKPVELLGLTATPERADGLPILDWFDHRIAAELRLWDAIDQHRLVPFAYYGIHDQLDLSDIPWRRGRGYVVDGPDGLSNLFTSNDAWGKLVLQELHKRVDRLASMRALGFCVSIEHARFMATLFNKAQVPACAIWSDTPAPQRRAALADLAARRVNIVFSVDLFNEGVDVPAVDTVLMLRPTESPTLFLQQLGRGLRKCEGKSQCLVLDFVGHHRKEFRFDRRFRALLGGSRSDLIEQVQHGFPFLPAGCHMELDRVARDIVLASVRDAVPTRWTEKVAELRQVASGREACSLVEYLSETGMELEDVYTGTKSWSDLCADAGLSVQPEGPHEMVLRRACGRLLHVDDACRLNEYRAFLSADEAPEPARLGVPARRLLRMLVSPLVNQVVAKNASLDAGCALLWQHPQVRAELLALLDALQARIEHLPHSLYTHPTVPLQVHARYTRVEILAAFGIGDGAKVIPWQTGVLWAEEALADLLAFTLDKTTGQFSPTTRYRDYAISPSLIHWESQSVTRAESETGLRYRRHRELGTHVMLFARLRSDERAFYFLGPATYVRHESELPMAVTWKLDHPLPGDLYATFAAAVA
jgi:superfamily II DNA or RNA helicase/HKD family nuclease